MRSIYFISLLTFFVQVVFTQNSDPRISQLPEIRGVSCDSALVVGKSIQLDSALFTPVQNAQLNFEMGATNYCVGDYEASLKYYQRALDFFDSEKSFQKAVEILNLIGTLQKKQGNMDMALDYFQQGLEKAEMADDLIGQGNSLNNIGLVYLQTDRPNEALDYFLSSTDFKSQANDTIGLSYNYDNLGMVSTQLEDFDAAERYFLQAGEYKKLIGDETGYAIVQNNIGEMLIQAGKSSQAEPYFLKALEVANRTNYRDFRQYVLSKLAEVQENQGNIDQAYSYFKKHVALRDSLFNERKSEQIANLELGYQTEKKEREIAEQQAEIEQKNLLLMVSGGMLILLVIIGWQGRSRLKWKNRQLLEEEKRRAREAEMNAIISSQEKERNRFARDLHDGFGQLISTLNLNLKSISTGKSKEDREKVFKTSSEVIEEMHRELRNICFDLMPQTLIRQGLSSALAEFASRINATGAKRVEVNIFGLDERLSELQEISLYRISQEWVNNNLKYSDAEKITIQITKDEEEITLLIEDDGAGFDPEILKQGKGNGWRNMTSRANLLNAEIEVDSSQGFRGSALILNIGLDNQVNTSKEEAETTALQDS